MQNTQKEKTIPLDSVSSLESKKEQIDLPLSQIVKKRKSSSALFSKHGIVSEFTTKDSKLYFVQSELEKIRSGQKIYRAGGKIDSAVFGYDRKSSKVKAAYQLDLYQEIKDRYSNLEYYLKDLFAGSVRGVGVMRMWNISLVASIIFGMFLMTMIYRYLGLGASAGMMDTRQPVAVEQVLGAETSKEDARSEAALAAKRLVEYENSEQGKMEAQMRQMVKGYPIEKMVPYIAKKDKTVAAFIIAIARQESSWGTRVPVLNGDDCYNYWGYRGKRARMGTGGHTCFDNPEDAVNTVAKRIEFLVSNEKITTPAQMVTVWKCGYDCSWDSKVAVQNWIDHVDTYFRKLNQS